MHILVSEDLRKLFKSFSFLLLGTLPETEVFGLSIVMHHRLSPQLPELLPPSHNTSATAPQILWELVSLLASTRSSRAHQVVLGGEKCLLGIAPCLAIFSCFLMLQQRE